MDDVKLALLGSKEAAKRLTDAGVLVPCPFCWKDAVMHVVESGSRYAEHKKEIPKGARFLRCVCYPNGKRYFEYCVAGTVRKVRGDTGSPAQAGVCPYQLRDDHGGKSVPGL